MSDVSKFFESFLNGVNDAYHAVGPKGVKPLFVDDGKNDLRGAQLEQILGGVPGVGDFLRGIEGANQLEDLYNSTGKTPAYPAIQNSGMGGLGHLASKVSKIESGSHDLYKYYSGENDTVEDHHWEPNFSIPAEYRIIE